jgi:cell wall-associated NlpC family hydrolase
MTRWSGRVLLAVSVMASVLLPARAALAYSDVSTNYWDYAAIKYVAIDHSWMKDFADGTFRPRNVETRRLLARNLVNAYAPTQSIDPNLTFPDLPKSDPFYPFANVAVKNGWLATWSDGSFHPTDPVSTRTFEKAILLAMGLSGPADALANIHEDGGYAYNVGPMFPYLQLANALGLRYNHDSAHESMDLEPADPITRDEVAYSLYVAKSNASYLVAQANAYRSLVLPTHDPAADRSQPFKRAVTAFALDYVGDPYIWGGEWDAASPPGYCCGTQIKGGFDCSGFVWWLMKKAGEGGYDNSSVRPYAGWSLPQRTSYDMAHATTTKISYAMLKTGDLMLFSDGGGKTWQDADHVGVYLGNGWMIHSTGSNAGAAIDSVSSGWWRDHLLWGRRLIPTG